MNILSHTHTHTLRAEGPCSHACNVAGQLVCVCVWTLIRLYKPGLGLCCCGRLHTNELEKRPGKTRIERVKRGNKM